MNRTAIDEVRLGAAVAAVALLLLGIGAADYVEAGGVGASPGHYPLDQTGGIAVPSADLDRYLATLEERATARQFLLTFGDLLFAANSARIGASQKDELLRMADFLLAHPATVALIVGHADDRGDATTNSRLAEQRADAVRGYLVVQGIDHRAADDSEPRRRQPTDGPTALSRIAPAIVG